MKKMICICLAVLLCLTGFAGCVQEEKNMENTYQQITAQEAKTIMDTEKDYIIIDARTEAELPDKEALILVYCRSGRRSKIASEELVKLGYTNVKEFGGIIDWPYETTTED